jgi:hypothetical protein
MVSWESCIAKYLLVIWLYFIAKCTLAIWQHLIAKCMLAIWRQPIAKHLLAILATSYCLNRNDRVSSFYKTRGSKLCLCFLTCFSKILSLLSYSSIFVKLLLTNFFAPFLAAWISNISSHFLYLWYYKLVRRTCAPIFLAQNAWVSRSKTLVGTW